MTKCYTLLISLFTCLFLLLPASATAQLKVAVVDVNQVLNNLDESKTKKKEIEKMSEKAKDKIEEKKEELRDLEESAKDSKDEDQLRELQREARNFERLVKDTDQDLKRKFIAINRDLTLKALNAVKKYAEEKGLDLVLDKNSSARGPLLYGSEEIDITEAVIDSMD